MYESVSYCGAGKFVSHGEWIHPDRIINSHEIIFVINGNVYINEGGVEYHLKKNDLLLLDPGVRHFGFKHSTNTSFFWLHFAESPRIPFELKYQNINEAYNLSLLFKQLMHYRAGERGDERLDYLTRLILLECFSTSKKEDHANRIISEIAAWISANRDTPLKVSLVSKHFGYNADYLCRIFKAHFGKSLKEYLDEIKIDHVKQVLLTSNMSLKEVAYNTGFGDYKYFLKFFKYHEGITPTQFLKSYPKTHINKN